MTDMLRTLGEAVLAAIGFILGMLAFAAVLWMTRQPWWSAPVVVSVSEWFI